MKKRLANIKNKICSSEKPTATLGYRRLREPHFPLCLCGEGQYSNQGFSSCSSNVPGRGMSSKGQYVPIIPLEKLRQANSKFKAAWTA